LRSFAAASVKSAQSGSILLKQFSDVCEIVIERERARGLEISD
jgi:hypothetical protein